MPRVVEERLTMHRADIPTKTKSKPKKSIRTRVFVLSLLPEHRMHIKALLFTDLYEFFHNDMVPEGIDWMFYQLQCHLPKFALYASGSMAEVQKINRVRKEDIHVVIYKELHDAFTYPDGVWKPFALIQVLNLEKQISLKDYITAETHSMHW
ncbi:hypothetical protein PM082_022124 [Marasmius tenuissimus]|nr:hypothetical protein PM082_022124 [Marasmius tenuissimus]